MSIQTYKVHWQGIEIEAQYKPRDFHGTIAHLVIKSINLSCTPLPMTETGFKLHFHPIGTIERMYGGNVVACVLDWLETAAQEKHWIDFVEASQQGELFLA